MFFNGLTQGDTTASKTMASSVMVPKRKSVYKCGGDAHLKLMIIRVSLSKERIAVLFRLKCLWIFDLGELL